MTKTYSGERIPGTVRYTIKIRGNQTDKTWSTLEAGETRLDTLDHDESAFRTALSVLSDYTGDRSLALNYFRDFKEFLGDLFKQDFWFLHSHRIDLFLKEVVFPTQHSQPAV
ncbi:hypothetical protein P3G55_09340 [Leptospira sp. 96542]|nr:hypothetical protein [Leptospira sp. 96542]